MNRVNNCQNLTSIYYKVSEQLKLELVQEKFSRQAIYRGLIEQAFHLSGFAQPYLPAISTHDPKVIDMFRWKLMPQWVKEESAWKATTHKAKGEELLEKGTYKNYWKNRCLLIYTGFFEPHHPERSEKSKSFYVKSKTWEFLTIGWIYSFWNRIPTFSILTAGTSSPQEHPPCWPKSTTLENGCHWFCKEIRQRLGCWPTLPSRK